MAITVGMRETFGAKGAAVEVIIMVQIPCEQLHYWFG